MFSFHKPKIYRSLSGCCICKAKSSSSRFTDSKKYEVEFEKCFRISEKRSGEICNACVLLVKRWKKLPAGTNRDWHHVVDARAGPGTKSIKAKLTNNGTSTTTSSNHNHLHIHKKHLKPKKSKALRSDTKEDGINHNINESSIPQIRLPSPTATDSSDLDEDIDEEENDIDEEYEEREHEQKKRKSHSRHISNLRKYKGSSSSSIVSSDKRNNINSANNKNNTNDNNTATKISSFLDMSFWRKEKICCGIIFKGPDNELLVYPKLLRPCCNKNSGKNVTIGSNGSSDTGSMGSSLIEDDASSNASSGNNSFI